MLSVKENASKPEVSARLADYFHRNGYVRRIDAVRRAEEGQLYKKGAEVRLVANSRAELAEIRRLLRQAGLEPGEADRENPRAAAMASECRTSSGGGFAVPRLADRYGGSALSQESR